jgi:ribulose-phosphate 3-epimerase
MQLYPSILTDSPELFAVQIEISKRLKGIEVVQVDVIDGQSIDNLTLTPLDLVGIELDQLQLDFHLMVEEPIDYLDEIISNREQLSPRAVIAQIEQMSSQTEFVEQAKANKLKVGLALNLFSPLEELEYQLLDRLDMVQLMGVEMGFQGQSFHPCAYEKIKSLKLLRQQRQLSFEIVIDGGIKADNISLIQQSGADAVVVGSWLWNNDQPQQMVESVTEL